MKDDLINIEDTKFFKEGKNIIKKFKTIGVPYEYLREDFFKTNKQDVYYEKKTGDLYHIFEIQFKE